MTHVKRWCVSYYTLNISGINLFVSVSILCELDMMPCYNSPANNLKPFHPCNYPPREYGPKSDKFFIRWMKTVEYMLWKPASVCDIYCGHWKLCIFVIYSWFSGACSVVSLWPWYYPLVIASYHRKKANSLGHWKTFICCKTTKVMSHDWCFWVWTVKLIILSYQGSAKLFLSIL